MIIIWSVILFVAYNNNFGYIFPTNIYIYQCKVYLVVNGIVYVGNRCQKSCEVVTCRFIMCSYVAYITSV